MKGQQGWEGLRGAGGQRGDLLRDCRANSLGDKQALC